MMRIISLLMVFFVAGCIQDKVTDYSWAMEQEKEKPEDRIEVVFSDFHYTCSICGGNYETSGLCPVHRCGRRLIQVRKPTYTDEVVAGRRVPPLEDSGVRKRGSPYVD